MKFIPASLKGLVIVEPSVFADERGYFMETYSRLKYANGGIAVEFVQDNESSSSYGVVRGLHYQTGRHAQAKLVRVISGAVWDVAVDIRENSPTKGRYAFAELTGENKRQFFIPRGFAHGFAVLSEKAVFAYKCDNFYEPEYERGIRADDPDVGIRWPMPLEKMIRSVKDLSLHSFKETEFY